MKRVVVRFPQDVVARLDALSARVGERLRREVPRAAIVRALVDAELAAVEADKGKLEAVAAAVAKQPADTDVE